MTICHHHVYVCFLQSNSILSLFEGSGAAVASAAAEGK